MGALAGSLTITKFYVRGELPDDFREQYLRRIRLRAFEPLTPESDAEESIGWCVVSSPLDLDLTYENVFYNSYLNLGLRMDRWRLPSAILKSQLEGAISEHLAKTGKERVSKVEKDGLKSRLASKLKRKLLPAMRAFDFSWDLERMKAYLWSQSPKIHEQLSVLFEQTFGLELAANSPFIQAMELGLGPAEVDRLSRLEPSPLHALRQREE